MQKTYGMPGDLRAGSGTSEDFVIYIYALTERQTVSKLDRLLLVI